jgi:hypothetical protein
VDTGPEVIEPHHPNLPLSQHTWVQNLFDISRKLLEFALACLECQMGGVFVFYLFII